MQPATPRLVSRPLQAANLALVVLAPAVFLVLRGRLPDRVPVHFGWTGRPDRFGSPDELWAVFALMALLYGLLRVMIRAIAAERRTAPPEAPERYAALELRRRTGLVRFAEASMLVANATLATVALSIALGSLPGLGGILSWMPAASVAIALVGLSTVLLAWVPRLSRIQAEQRALGIAPVARPGAWRWGVFYFAPDDPAVFVPKRVGIGLTLNFGRPAAWLFLAAVIGLPLLLAVLSSPRAE